MRRILFHIVGIFASRPRLAAALALAALFAVAVFVKLGHWPPAPFFYSDPAFRFRYVEMYATGEALPALDRPAQWPEGVRPAVADFLTQDAFIGLSYRLLKPFLPAEYPPENFLALQVTLWSSLSLVVVYAWARRLFGSRPGAFLAALVYVCALPIYLRCCGNYLREDFVLPAFFFGLYAAVRLLEGGSWRWMLAAAAAFFIALIGWHASSFLLFFAAVVVAAFAVIAAQPAGAARAAGALAAAALAAWILHPALRAKVLPATPAFALLLAALGAALLAGKKRLPWWGRALALGGLFGLFYLAGRPFAAAGEYSHIYTMVFYKLRYLGVKPADPLLLPTAAREIWSGPANSPPGAQIFVLFIGPVLIGLLPLILSFKKWVKGFREGAAAAGAATLALLVLFGLLYLFYQRFAVLFIFPLAALAAGYAAVEPRLRRVAALLIPAAIIPLEAIKAASYEDQPWPWTRSIKAAAGAEGGWSTAVGDEEVRLIRWFANQAGHEDAAVMAPISTSAQLLTYARVPICLHPIYEAPGMRAKVRECWGALYQSEEEFYGVCRKYDATYVAFNAAMVRNAGTDSNRYAAGITRVRADSCAYKMCFAPAELAHFACVFETASWRVFLVGTPGREAPALGPPPVNFQPPARPGPYYDDRETAAADARVKAAVAVFNEGVDLYDAHDLPAARERFRRAVALCPELTGAWTALAWVELDLRNPEGAYRAAMRAAAQDPHDPQPMYVFATLGVK